MSQGSIDDQINKAIQTLQRRRIELTPDGRHFIEKILYNYYSRVMTDVNNELSSFNKSTVQDTLVNVLNGIMDLYLDQNKSQLPVGGDYLRNVLYWTQFGSILPQLDLSIYTDIDSDGTLSQNEDAESSYFIYNPYAILDKNYNRVDIVHTSLYTAPISTGENIDFMEYQKFIQLFWNSIQLPLIEGEYPSRPDIHPDVLNILGQYLQKEDSTLHRCNDIQQLGNSFNLNCKPNGWRLEDTYSVDYSGKNKIPETPLEGRTNFLNVILITFIGRAFFECINYNKKLRLMNMYRSITGISNPSNFDTTILTWKHPVYPNDFEIPPLIFLGNRKLIPKKYFISNIFIETLILNLIERKFPLLHLGESGPSIALSIRAVLEWFMYIFDMGFYKDVDYKPINEVYSKYSHYLGLDITHNITVGQLEPDKQKDIISQIESKLRVSLIPDVILEVKNHNIDRLYEYKNIKMS
jgi:hypothetical protein